MNRYETKFIHGSLVIYDTHKEKVVNLHRAAAMLSKLHVLQTPKKWARRRVMVGGQMWWRIWCVTDKNLVCCCLLAEEIPTVDDTYIVCSEVSGKPYKIRGASMHPNPERAFDMARFLRRHRETCKPVGQCFTRDYSVNTLTRRFREGKV